METSKTLKYVATGSFKHADEDVYKNGCSADGFTTSLQREKIEASTLEELLDGIMTYCGCEDKKSVLLNACDELGRVDVQVYETKDGKTANSADLARWKRGERRLWLCDYSFEVEEVLSEIFDFDNMEGADEYELNE